MFPDHPNKVELRTLYPLFEEISLLFVNHEVKNEMAAFTFHSVSNLGMFIHFLYYSYRMTGKGKLGCLLSLA